MYSDDYAPKMKVQPRRLSTADRPPFGPGVAGRFLDAAATAVLLDVTEDLLLRWYATGHGLQPVLRPGGRLYRAEHVEQLAAMPRVRRMLAISRLR